MIYPNKLEAGDDMSKDDFRDEFEKSKQPIERQEDTTEEIPVTNDEERTENLQAEDNQEFPPRGVSRRTRSAERRRRSEDHEESADVEEAPSDKRRKRSVTATAGTGAAVNSGRPQDDDKVSRKTFVAGTGAAGAGAVSNEAEAESVDREVEEEDHKSGNKLIPLLAALLVLIPIILLIGMYINNQINGPDKNNDVAVTADKKETSTEEKTTEKAAKDKDDKDSKTAAADKSTEEAAAEEAVTEETTTEEVTTEEAVTEETTTEETTTEQATTETPSTEEADEDSSNTVGTTHVVGSNENLYRIAIKYYGSGSAENVEKIRRANGLSGNEIGAGQTLVIPK